MNKQTILLAIAVWAILWGTMVMVTGECAWTAVIAAILCGISIAIMPGETGGDGESGDQRRRNA